MKSIRVLKQSDLLHQDSKGLSRFCPVRDRNVVVEASAGTGKTFALEELVLELALVVGIPFQKILIHVHQLAFLALFLPTENP